MKLSGVPCLARALPSLALACAVAFGAALPARAEMMNEAAWKQGAQWMSLRAGYAKSETRFAPNGNFGWGFGYSRMVSRRISLGANFEQDLLGKFGGASMLDFPVVFETQWHFAWRTALRPYFGLGMGAVYRKTYRTGADRSNIQPAYTGSVGVNTPIDKNHLLGLDVRLSGVSSDRPGENPVFQNEKPRNGHWGVKLVYALTY